ncbi:hypothetical protein TWF281_005374 [Arthrobotrys megalospora]
MRGHHFIFIRLKQATLWSSRFTFSKHNCNYQTNIVSPIAIATYNNINGTMSEQPVNPLAGRFAAADVYDKLTGGWPPRVAKNIIAGLPAAITPESVILDNCCGSGAITTAIVDSTTEKGFIPKINSTDLSPGMIEHVSNVYKEVPEVHTKIMDAQTLEFPDNTFSHVICAFGVFFCPDYEAGYREMYRVAAPGSVTVITSWKVVGWLPVVNYVIKKIKPEQKDWEFPAPPGFAEAEWVKERMVNAGWKDVEVREIEDYTSATPETRDALLPVMKDAFEGWTDEEKAQWGDLFTEAAEFYNIPKTEDGGWKIQMVALEVTGRK